MLSIGGQESLAQFASIFPNSRNFLGLFEFPKMFQSVSAWFYNFMLPWLPVTHHHVCPGKPEAKPDALTRHWDVYHTGGNSNFTMVNLTNLQPIFTQEQLTASLHATYLATPTICHAVLMDIEKLHNDICSNLHLDPISAAHLPTPTAPN